MAGATRKAKYVHVSFDVVEEFLPRVPKQRTEGEDDKISRICVSDSVLHSLNAMVDAGKVLMLMQRLNLPLIIHVYYMDSNDAWDTDVVSKYVPDAKEHNEKWLLSAPKGVHRIDYLIEDPYMAYVGEKHVAILGVSLKRIQFADNIANLANKFGANTQKLRDLVKDFGYAEMLCNIGPELIKLQEERGKKIA